MFSKHIFMFPFRWDVKILNKDYKDTPYAERISLDVFHNKLANTHWKEITNFKTDTPEKYNARTYFYPFVRKIVFPDPEYKSFRQYEYPTGQNATYQIQVVKMGDDPFEKNYELVLKAITLNVYDLGVGVLSFSLENHTYASSDDILRINDYGRRLYPQFIPVGSNFDLTYTRNSFLAASIRLTNEDKSLDVYTDFDHTYHQSPAYLPPHILNLLNGNQTDAAVFRTEKFFKNQTGVRIEPVLDDRMFTLCWYGNTTIANELSELDGESYKLTAHKDFWYRYIFVDTDLTCPDPLLKKKLLDQSTYTRWLPDKTLFGVSRYSFVALTDSGWFGENLLSIHLTDIYARLAMICLVQRAALLRFSGEVSYVSRQIKPLNDLTFTSAQVQDLNSSYIQFDNRFYFEEVTAQEQGIELYDMLHNQMRLAQNAGNVKQEISELNNYVQTASGESERITINRLGLIGGLFGIASFVMSYFGLALLDFRKSSVPPLGYWFVGGLILLLILVTVLLIAPVWLLKLLPDSIRKPTPRRWLLSFALLIISALVIAPFIISYRESQTPDPTPKSVVDSTASKKIEGSRIEVRPLPALQQHSTTLPKSSTAQVP